MDKGYSKIFLLREVTSTTITAIRELRPPPPRFAAVTASHSPAAL